MKLLRIDSQFEQNRRKDDADYMERTKYNILQEQQKRELKSHKLENMQNYAHPFKS